MDDMRRTVGAASFGNRTPASSLPRATASFNGESAGLVVLDDGQFYYAGSDIEVFTDFEAIDVTSSNTGVISANDGSFSPAPELDFTGSGSIEGSEFSMSIRGSEITGSANGAFFGPQDQEVGGIFSIGSAEIEYVGSFGAR